MSHRRAADEVEGRAAGCCDQCGEPLDEPAPRRGVLSRLSRATRGGLVAGALVAIAALGSGCGDDSGGKSDARLDSGPDIPIATPYGISPVVIEDLA